MKKLIIHTMLLTTTYLISGCQISQHIFFGTRNAIVKTEKQIEKYELRKGLQTDNNYSLRDSLTFQKYFSLLSDEKLGKIEVYDNKGRMLPPYDTTGCPAPFYRYINGICTTPQEVFEDSLLQNKMLDFVPFSSNKAEVDPSKYDYTIVIYWARFYGTVNKSNAREFERLLSQQKDCKIQYIKVSLDPRDFWNMRE